MDSHQTTRIISSIQLSLESSLFIYAMTRLLGALLQLNLIVILIFIACFVQMKEWECKRQRSAAGSTDAELKMCCRKTGSAIVFSEPSAGHGF